MYVEISVSVNYLLSHLYTKLPRRRVDNFGEELERCLLLKLQPHWLTESPGQDAFHRCFHTSGPHTDFIFPEAAISSGLEWSEIQACLPAGLVITIDPGHVACQYGTIDSPQMISNSAWSAGNGCNSMSLSSSGCSSASSVSSSNSSSGSWSKTKHQILYSANSRDGDGYTINGEKEADETSNEVLKKQLEEVQTHLATEAALSVLTEPEEPLPDPDASKLTSSNECITGVGDSCEYQEKTLNSASGSGKYNHADPTGDGCLFDHTVNSESQAKCDIENEFPLHEFLPKPLRQVDEVGEAQQFDFHNQPSFTQSSAALVQKSTLAPSFTAATFAATKFGSTKLKNQTKRPHRLVAPTSGYTSQLMEAIGQNSVQSNQMPLCDRLMRLNGLHRNGASYNNSQNPAVDTSRNGFYENYQLLDRSNDIAFNNNGYANSLLDNVLAMGIYGNSETPMSYRIRSKNLVNNPMWSQFEKIRSEFQLKNSQYLQQHQQQHGNSPLLNCNSAFDLNTMESNTTSSRCITAFNTTAPRNALPHFDGKCNFGEDLGLSQDLHDLWNSQKFASNNGNNFCWSGDVNKSSIDTSLGQAFNALNITER